MSEPLPRIRRFLWAAHACAWVARYSPEVLASVSGTATIAIALISYLAPLAPENAADNQRTTTVWLLTLAAVAVASTVASVTLNIRRRVSDITLEQRASDLQKEREESLRRLVRATEEVALQLLADCNAQNTHTRLTVYQHEPSHERFIPVGRISDNPRLRLPGRKSYPDSKGAIHAAWTDGEYIKVRMSADTDEWTKEQAASGYTREEAQAMSMKSRSILGVRIQHGSSFVGVLIMESLKPQGVTSAMLDTLKNHQSYLELVRMLDVGVRAPAHTSEDETPHPLTLTRRT